MFEGGPAPSKRIGREKTRPAPFFWEFIAGCGIYIFVAAALGTKREMRSGFRRVTSVLAIYAIALHAILGGVSLAAGANPFAVICHNEAAPGEAPAGPSPAQPCNHCTLCSVTAAPPLLAIVAIGDVLPPRLLQVLHPVSTASGSALVFQHKLARGPPHFG